MLHERRYDQCVYIDTLTSRIGAITYTFLDVGYAARYWTTHELLCVLPSLLCIYEGLARRLTWEDQRSSVTVAPSGEYVELSILT